MNIPDGFSDDCDVLLCTRWATQRIVAVDEEGMTTTVMVWLRNDLTHEQFVVWLDWHQALMLASDLISCAVAVE